MSSFGTIILQKQLVTTDHHLSTWKKYNVRLVKVLASTRLLWKSSRFVILGNFSEAHINSTWVATWIKQLHISPTEGTWGCGGHLLVSKVCGCVRVCCYWASLWWLVAATAWYFCSCGVVTAGCWISSDPWQWCGCNPSSSAEIHSTHCLKNLNIFSWGLSSCESNTDSKWLTRVMKRS